MADTGMGDEEFAELEGRTTRTRDFLVREAHSHEVMTNDPARYMLEVWRGNAGTLIAVSEADIKALHSVLGNVLAGNPLPKENNRG